MKKISFTLFVTLLITLMFSGCKKWEEYNTDPYGVTPELLAADFNDVGAYFPTIQQGIYNNTCEWAWEIQTAQNLTADTWSGYMMSSNPFQNNINPSTLNLIRGWCGGHWDLSYRDVMSPIFTSIEEKCKVDYPHFLAIAQILRGITMLRVMDTYGPVIYSQYGKSSTGSAFDTQEEAYNHLFKELDEAIATLTDYLAQYPDATPFQAFDLLNGGDNKRWIQFANSIKLRAAIHISKVNPTLAKKEAEEAVSNQYGVIETGVVAVSGKGWVHPLYVLTNDYGDINMNAVMESIMSGYEDPRMGKYFVEVTDKALQEAGYKYKGIRMGIQISTKETYQNHSRINVERESAGVLLSSAEVWLLRAEGALRGWSMGGTAKELYEAGVQASFVQWGAGSANDYLQSDNMPAAFVDIYNHDNDIPADSRYMNKVSPKWDESASNEIKLQKIITQKWLAVFPEGIEGWTEQRRTGYPILFPVMVNESQGIFKNDDIVKRMTFPDSFEYNGQMDEAVQKLGGPDTGNTRLWWDTGTGNF